MFESLRESLASLNIQEQQSLKKLDETHMMEDDDDHQQKSSNCLLDNTLGAYGTSETTLHGNHIQKISETTSLTMYNNSFQPRKLQQPILSDIILIPRRERTYETSHRRSASQPPKPLNFIDVSINSSSVPFLSPGRHRVWNGLPNNLLVPCPTSFFPSTTTTSPELPSSNNNEYLESVLHHPALNFQKAAIPNTSTKGTSTVEFLAILPSIVNSYIFLILNAMIVMAIVWGIWFFITAFGSDVIAKVTHHSLELSEEAQHCKDQYERNRCNPSERVPALEATCREWQLCMNAEIAKTRLVKRAVLSAETLGQTLNAFLEQFSWKSTLLFVCAISTIVACTNALLLTVGRFGTLRSTTNRHSLKLKPDRDTKRLELKQK